MKPNKVLVVDDAPLVHRIYGSILKGVTLIGAPDGAAGLRALAEHADVDLILLDINMPVMNGVEFMTQVKQHATAAKIPVIVVSTEDKDFETIAALRAGAAAFIAKPFRGPDLLDLISKLPPAG